MAMIPIENESGKIKYVDFVITEDNILLPLNLKVIRGGKEDLLPPTRDVAEDIDGMNGEYYQETEYDAKSFELVVVTKEGLTSKEKYDLKRDIASMLNPLNGTKSLVYLSNPNEKYMVDIERKIEITPYPTWFQFTIPFVMYNPFTVPTFEDNEINSNPLQIPEYIEVKVNNKTVAYLSPNDGLKDCYPDMRVNGESTFEFSLPSNSEKIKELTPECEIYANNKVYNILKDEAIETVMDDKGRLWTKFMAVERWNLLDKQLPEPYITNDPTIPSPADLAVIIVGGGSDLSNGAYSVGTAAHALHAVLQGSDWQMGICDVTGLHDLETEKVSRLQLIKMIQATWGGILIWDSVNKVVHLRDEDVYQPYHGFQVRYAKNLKHINRTQSNRLVTKLYCFGKDDLDIASVNGGVKYLTDFSYTAREYTNVYSNPDIEDALELKQKGLAELALNCKPRYNYSVKIVDLRVLPEYSHEEFTLGDMVDIITSKLEIDERIRIIRHRYNLFQPWQCEFELGDPLERFIEKLKTSFESSDLINNTFDSSGNMSGSKLVDGSVINNKIANAALDASKFDTKQIILTGDVWNDNAPLNGSVAWNSHKLFFGGVEYSIIGGNTNKKYIVWQKDISNNSYRTYTEEEFASVVLKDYDFVIAVNNGGLHDVAWYNRLARQFIGSVFIADAAIKQAHIANAAITSAKIADAAITNAKIGTAAIKSANIEDLAVTSLKIGNTAITEDKIAALAVTNGKIADLAITNAKIANATIQSAKIVSLSADKITAGTITAIISIESPRIYSGTYYGQGSNPASIKLGLGSQGNLGDLGIYRGGGSSPIFQIYDDLSIIDLKALGNRFLGTTGVATYAYGTWNFSTAGTINWGNNAPVAKFA